MEQIRKARITDELPVYKLIAELEGEGIDWTRFAEIYQKHLRHPKVQYWVYEMDGMISGFVSIHMQELLHHAARIAEIQELIVEKDMRGRGIGKKLFQKAGEIGRENGCMQLEVCCNQKRLASHAFYEAQGMTNHHYKFCMPLVP